MAKQRLGRGLEALLESTDVLTDSEPGIFFVNPENLQPNPYQPRKEFSDEALQELAQSIKQQGIITPITVEPIGNGDYYIIAGCVPREFLKAYSKGKKLFANIIYDAQRFVNPQPLDYYFKHNDDTLRCNKNGIFACHKCGKSCRVVKAPQCYCFIQV